jgi:DUF4097 and DUF4098 domain-containing protein YvlB
MKTQILISGLLLIPMLVMAQVHTEKISKELTFEKLSSDNALMIANISGDITVTSYAGTKIIVEVTKTIKAKTNERLEKGKKEVQLGLLNEADTLILFVDGTCNTFSKQNRKAKGDGRWMRNWNYDWNNCDQNCREEYDYTMDFVVKVPASINVLISTVNNGDLVVENVNGAVSANNVNGSIKLTNLMREADASTINGDVDIVYAKNPQQDCRFYSLNGDINAWFQKGLAATMSFESFNGDFFTNIDQLESLPVQVEKKNTNNGIKYKVSGNRYKIGSGGAFLDFETFNGNVYLKEK